VSKPPAEQAKQLLDNASLQEFLTFLKQEREFADATIVNRERSLKPFLGWLVAKMCLYLNIAVSPVRAKTPLSIHRRFLWLSDWIRRVHDIPGCPSRGSNRH